MGKEIRNENLEICQECGGMCCKKSGCDYSADDFKNCSYNNLVKELSKGDKSIICYLNFKEDSLGNITYEPFLYLRARNNNRDIVDLISIKTGCSLLLETGCSLDYNNRPCGGRNLKPVRSSEGNCMPLKNPMDIVNTWKPHQKTLKRLVMTFTGKGVNTKIREDVENLFYELLTEDLSLISQKELEDIKGFVPLLIKAFPNELKNASIRYNNNKPKVLVKNK